MPPYEAVCFDLDSTLCVSTQDSERLLRTAFERANCEPFCTPTELRSLVPELPTAETDREFHENLFGVAAERNGADPTLAPRLADAYLGAWDPTAVRFREGAESALARARDRANGVALITNGGRETQTRKLDALGIADAFDVAVFTDPADGVLPKPNPAPFERALGGLGAEPDATVHVGDSLYADIAGANAMGMDSVWLPAAEATAVDHEPTYELASLESFSSVV